MTAGVRPGIICSLLVYLLAATCGLSSAEVVTLSEGIRRAVTESRSVRVAEYDEDISRDDAMSARAKMLPEINAEFASTHLRYQPAAIFGPQTVPMSERDFPAYSIYIRQTLYDFGERSSKYDAAGKDSEARAIDTRRTKNLAAVEFALAYLDLLDSEKSLVVSGKEVERFKSHLGVARSMFEEGAITKNDVLQAEVRLSDASQRLLASRNARSINESRVNSLLLQPLDRPVETVDVGETPVQIIEIKDDEASLIALRDRPEMQVMDLAVQSLQLRKAAARSAYFPKLFVKGSYDYTENRYQVRNDNWSLILGVGVNLFSGGSTVAEVSKIDHQIMKTEEIRKKLADDIQLDVKRYMLTAKNTRERIAVTKDAVQQAEENLRISKVKYQEGAATATEALDAVTLLTVAETNYNRALYDSKKADIAVLYSLGRDLLEVYK